MKARESIENSLIAVPAGRWVVGVSGGSDSVALLSMLVRFRSDIVSIVAHLDHQRRGTESDADRVFVESLCATWRLECVSRRRSDFDAPDLGNRSAADRAVRFELFRQACAQHAAQGVLLAHHADDLAETVLLRLLRGGEAWALAGLATDAVVRGVRVHRPLLQLRKSILVEHLRATHQSWREDSSNTNTAYARNAVRALLRRHPQLNESLLDLASSARQWRRIVRMHELDSLAVDSLAERAAPFVRASIRARLQREGVSIDRLRPAVIDQIIRSSRDLALPASVNLPGGFRLVRSRGLWRVKGPHGP